MKRQSVGEMRGRVWTLSQVSRFPRGLVCVGLLLVAGGFSFTALANEPADSTSASEENILTQQAKGSFEVELKPLPFDLDEGDPLLGRMSLDKRFEGDLVGTSQGEMLSARTATPGSAGYVAIEKVEGRLGERSGTFVLQHSSTLTRGEPRQEIQVVPGSGTGELSGLKGSMVIDITEGQHLYTFDYDFDSEE